MFAVHTLSMYTLCFNCGIFFLPLANLTGHTERVGMENFELLKVLGTGGECLKHEMHEIQIQLLSILKKYLSDKSVKADRMYFPAMVKYIEGKVNYFFVAGEVSLRA